MDSFGFNDRFDYPGSSRPNWELLNLQSIAAGGKLLQRRAEAEARVANAVRAVVRQRNIATALRRRNMNASDAEARLAQLERKLSDFEQQLASIMQVVAHTSPQRLGSGWLRSAAFCLKQVSEAAIPLAQQICFGIAATDERDAGLCGFFEHSSPPSVAQPHGRQAGLKCAGTSSGACLAV